MFEGQSGEGVGRRKAMAGDPAPQTSVQSQQLFQTCSKEQPERQTDKAAVKKNDPKNGIAVHAWVNHHQVNWEAASVKQEERIYWRRRVLEALHIHQQHQTSNLTVD